MTSHTRGFALLSLVFVVIAMIAAAAVPVMIWIERDRAIELEQWQFQLHDARVMLFRLRHEKPDALTWQEWQQAPMVREWRQRLEQQGVVVDIDPYFQSFDINLGNIQRAQQLARRLVHTDAEGTVLRIPLPESQNLESNQWLPRQHSAPMQTDLILNHHQITGIQYLEGNRAVLSEAQLQSSLAARSVETKSVLAGSELTTNHADIGRVSSPLVNVQDLHSEEGLVEHLTFADGWISAGQANQVVASNAQMQRLESEYVTATQVTIHGPLRVSEQGGDLLATTAQRLNDLEQQIGHCIEISQWCLAPQLPELQLQSCGQCSLEQYEESFEAQLSISIQSCLHGCAVSVNQPIAIDVDCSPELIPSKTTGTIQCMLRGTLAEGQQRSAVLTVTAVSVKDASYRTTLDVGLQWSRRYNRCERTLHTMPIPGSVPFRNFVYEFPVRSPPHYYSDSFYEHECDFSRQSSRMDCEVSAYCGATFEWQNIEGTCVCH